MKSIQLGSPTEHMSYYWTNNENVCLSFLGSSPEERVSAFTHKEFSPSPYTPFILDADPSLEAQLLTSRPTFQQQGPNPSLKAQIPA